MFRTCSEPVRKLCGFWAPVSPASAAVSEDEVQQALALAYDSLVHSSGSDRHHPRPDVILTDFRPELKVAREVGASNKASPGIDESALESTSMRKLAHGK